MAEQTRVKRKKRNWKERKNKKTEEEKKIYLMAIEEERQNKRDVEE